MDESRKQPELQDQHSPSAGEPQVETPWPPRGRLSPFATLGSQLWFSVPIAAAMLALGAFAMPYAVSLSMEKNSLYARVLLGIYASGVALNMLDALVIARKEMPRGFGFQWRGGGTTAVYNFLLDLAFAMGVVVFDRTDDETITFLLFLLTGIRFLAHVAGRPWPLFKGRPVPVVALAALLPPAFVALQANYTPRGDPAGPALLRDTILIVVTLPMIYAIFANLNQRIAEETELEEALAERDAKLRASQKSAELDAKRLAEQVLRLDILQDGIAAINSAIELDDLLLMIVNNAVRVLNAEQSSIGLVDLETGELTIQCATGVDSATLRRRRFPPGVGVAGWVVQNGKPLTVEDVRLDVRYVDPYTDDSIGRTTRSMVCVPLVAEDIVIGTLCVTHSEPNAISVEDQNLLTTFAEQAALAVHKGQLLEERTRQGEELRRRGELIASLQSIGQSVLSSLDLPEVLNIINSRISELFSFDRAMIYLLHERTGVEELVASSGSGLANREDLLLGPGTPAMELWQAALESGTVQACNEGVCLLCLPLVNRRRPLGCILLAREGSELFNDVERDTAEKVADAATMAIVNARLFNRVSVGQQQTASLYRLMLKVNTAPNRRQLALVICHELRRILGARSAALFINDTSGHINCWASSGDWRGQNISEVSLSAQGDPFVSSVLASLHEVETPDLVIVQNVPHAMTQLVDTRNAFTIPLTQGGRIYGLLVVDPGEAHQMPEEVRETLSLAISHSTVALERAELFEQTLAAARQSSMLYSIAAEVQTSLDQQTVVQMTVNGALEALPIQACELYLFDEGRRMLTRAGIAMAEGSESDKSSWNGPGTIAMDDNPTILQVLRSPGLIMGDLDTAAALAAEKPGTSVMLGRLMGSEEPLGILRIITDLPGEDFIHRHATFCQTLLTHSGGALERSRLYSTASTQARMLRQRAQQLTDILDLGSLSTANVALTTLMPRIAAGIARSLGFAYVRVGETGPDSAEMEVWASPGMNPPGDTSDSTARGDAWPVPVAEDGGEARRALTVDNVMALLEAGTPVGEEVNGVYLDEKTLARIVVGQRAPEGMPRQLILMPLRATGGDIEGYILAGQSDELAGAQTAERDLLEVLGIFAQRVALIIENHHIYNQLLDSTRKMETVVLSISDGVIVTDSELSILIHNSLAGRLLGSGAMGGAQALYLPWLIHNEDLIDLLRRCIAESLSESMDVDLRLGRDLRTYQAVVHPITSPDIGVLGAVLTLRDVTAERATERAKSDFLSIVSHELRTPLNSVMGFLDIILMGKTGPISELQSDFLGTAKREAVVLQRLINDVLDYSQLQSGMLRLDMAPLNLSSVISRVVNQARPRMSSDELTVVNEVEQGLVVVGDEIRLEQVFKNLLDNAAKFTDPGGEIRFECVQSEGRVTISVRDTGCGIPPAQVGDVFDRFFQAENNSTRQKHQRGLGLGLAICKNIVESHGGRIWIESELGVGTTVHVELLIFDRDSDLYDFDEKTGKATLAAPALQI